MANLSECIKQVFSVLPEKADLKVLESIVAAARFSRRMTYEDLFVRVKQQFPKLTIMEFEAYMAALDGEEH